MARITPKQEAFARAYIETAGNASEAYRRSYSAENMSNAAIAVEACRLLDDPKVALMVTSLKESAQKRHELTVDDIIAELEEARAMAMTGERPQASAMVAASMGKAKILGMVTDKVDAKLNGTVTHLYDEEQAKRMAEMLLRKKGGE